MLKQSREELINISGIIRGFSIALDEPKRFLLSETVDRIDGIIINEDRPFLREDVRAIIHDEIVSTINYKEDFNFDNITDKIMGLFYG